MKKRASCYEKNKFPSIRLKVLFYLFPNIINEFLDGKTKANNEGCKNRICTFHLVTRLIIFAKGDRFVQTSIYLHSNFCSYKHITLGRKFCAHVEFILIK